MPSSICLGCWLPLSLFKVLERRKKYDGCTKNRAYPDIHNVILYHCKKDKKIKNKNRRRTVLGGLCHHTDSICGVSGNNLLYLRHRRCQISRQYSLSDNNRHAPYQTLLYEHTDITSWKQGGESGSGDGVEGERGWGRIK